MLQEQQRQQIHLEQQRLQQITQQQVAQPDQQILLQQQQPLMQGQAQVHQGASHQQQAHHFPAGFQQVSGVTSQQPLTQASLPQQPTPAVPPQHAIAQAPVQQYTPDAQPPTVQHLQHPAPINLPHVLAVPQPAVQAQALLMQKDAPNVQQAHATYSHEQILQQQPQQQLDQDQLRVQLLLQQQLAQQQQIVQNQQQIAPKTEALPEEHARQFIHQAGEVAGVETQVSEEELVRATEVNQSQVTGSHPLAQKIQQQLVQPSQPESSVTVENNIGRAEREKVSCVSPQPVCPHPLACTPATPPAPVIFALDPPCHPNWDSEYGREGSRRGSLPVPTHQHTPPTPTSAPALLGALSHRLPFPSQITRRRSADPSELSRARQSLSARLASNSPTLWLEEQVPMIEVRRASGGTGAALSPLWEQQSLASGSLLPMFTIRETRAWSLSQSSLASGQVLRLTCLAYLPLPLDSWENTHNKLLTLHAFSILV